MKASNWKITPYGLDDEDLLAMVRAAQAYFSEPPPPTAREGAEKVVAYHHGFQQGIAWAIAKHDGNTPPRDTRAHLALAFTVAANVVRTLRGLDASAIAQSLDGMAGVAAQEKGRADGNTFLVRLVAALATFIDAPTPGEKVEARALVQQLIFNDSAPDPHLNDSVICAPAFTTYHPDGLHVNCKHDPKGPRYEGPPTYAPPCAACERDEHLRCGGPESGCGCAAANHYDEITAAPIPVPAPQLCAGCNVRAPFEHRCHGNGCPCTMCTPPTAEELEAILAEAAPAADDPSYQTVEMRVDAEAAARKLNAGEGGRFVRDIEAEARIAAQHPGAEILPDGGVKIPLAPVCPSCHYLRGYHTETCPEVCPTCHHAHQIGVECAAGNAEGTGPCGCTRPTDLPHALRF